MAHDPISLLVGIESRHEVFPDRWQVQVQARVQRKADVVVHTAAEVAEGHLLRRDDIAATVIDILGRRGNGATLAVLPEGPTTIAYLDVKTGG